MFRFSTVVLVAASIYLVDAFPGGAPSGACDNLTPSPSFHGAPQASDSPYVIDLTQFGDGSTSGSLVYTPGKTYTRKIATCFIHTFVAGGGGGGGTVLLI